MIYFWPLGRAYPRNAWGWHNKKNKTANTQVHIEAIRNFCSTFHGKKAVKHTGESIPKYTHNALYYQQTVIAIGKAHGVTTNIDQYQKWLYCWLVVLAFCLTRISSNPSSGHSPTAHCWFNIHALCLCIYFTMLCTCYWARCKQLPMYWITRDQYKLISHRTEQAIYAPLLNLSDDLCKK